MHRAFVGARPAVLRRVVVAPSNSHSVAGITALFCIACNVSAAAQYVPIRALDSNGLLQEEWPMQLSGDVVVGAGTPNGSPLPPSQAVLWDASGTTLLPLLTGDDFGEAAARNAAGVVVGLSALSNAPKE